MNKSYQEQQKLMHQIQKRKIHKYSWDYYSSHKNLAITHLRMPDINTKSSIDMAQVIILLM